MGNATMGGRAGRLGKACRAASGLSTDNLGGYGCEDSVTENGMECEYVDCYYELNILWLTTITVCQYRCGPNRITTRRWRRFLFWCWRLP